MRVNTSSPLSSPRDQALSPKQHAQSKNAKNKKAQARDKNHIRHNQGGAGARPRENSVDLSPNSNVPDNFMYGFIRPEAVPAAIPAAIEFRQVLNIVESSNVNINISFNVPAAGPKATDK